MDDHRWLKVNWPTHYLRWPINHLLYIALTLICVGCADSGGSTSVDEASKERVMTERSENLTMIMSENGRPSYIFKTPLVEGYTLGRDPYREFNKGVDIVTFSNDSLSQKESEMRSNYAIYFENQKLWEAVGDVVVISRNDRELYSQQLFWNAQTQMIYSNVETKIIDLQKGDVYIGEGFESDEKMENWRFRKLKGKMRMEIDNTNGETTINEE